MGLAERGELLKLLDSSTKTLDKIGELMRDVRLIRRRNPKMPNEYASLLRDLESYLRTVLSHHDSWEKSMTDVLGREAD